MTGKIYDNRAEKIVIQAEQSLSERFSAIDDTALRNQQKVLNAFIDNRISARHFAGTNGYGYDDVGARRTQ